MRNPKWPGVLTPLSLSQRHDIYLGCAFLLEYIYITVPVCYTVQCQFNMVLGLHAYHMPGISSSNMLKGQGHFHFAESTSIGKSLSQWETFEGHQGQDQGQRGATEAMVCYHK